MAVIIVKPATKILAALGICDNTLVSGFPEKGGSITYHGADITVKHANGYTLHKSLLSSQMSYLINDMAEELSPAEKTNIVAWLLASIADEGKAYAAIDMAKAEQKVLSSVETGDDSVVSLNKANKMYQLVFGTSGNSRYVTVAIAEGIKVADRYKEHDNSLSVRAEGMKVKGSLETNLTGLGMTVKDQGHASLHVSASTKSMAARALGALLSNINVDWQTPAPNQNKAFAKGV